MVISEPLGRALEEKINRECRTKKVKNIISYAKGLISRTFVDLGDEFVVVDKDGEDLPEVMVKSLSKEKQAVLELSENNKNPLEEGQMVQLDQLVGPAEANKKVFKVLQQLSLNKYTLDCDSSALPEYVRGGVLKALKSQVTVKNQALD